MDVQDYQDLVTSEYQNQPDFMATIALCLGMSVQIQDLLNSMLALFDLDSPPVGNQLDILGQWIGISRNVKIPLSGVFFSWDNPSLTLGWDKGSWQEGGQTTITALPDEAYLVLLRAKIGANNWNGTTTQLYQLYSVILAPYILLVQDNCNMSYELALIGGVVPALTLALLVGGYLPLKPQGILISKYLTSLDTNKAFSWDLDNQYCGGWNTCSWLQEIAPTNTPT